MTATFLAGTGHESSVPWPAHVAGDRLLLLVEHGGGTVATPTGYAIVDGFPLNQGGGSLLSAFDIVATSGAMGDAALAGGSNHMWGVIIRIRDAHPTAPYAHFAAMKQSGANTNGAWPALKVNETDMAMLAVAAYGVDNAGPMSASEANASLTDVAEVYDAGTATGDGGGIIVLSGTRAAVGMVSMWTSTLTSTVWVAAVFAIRPKPIYTVAGTAQIEGGEDPAPNGCTVNIWDETLGVLAATTTTTGGTGAFTALVPYADHLYRAVIEDDVTNPSEPKYGASAAEAPPPA